MRLDGCASAAVDVAARGLDVLGAGLRAAITSNPREK
jgi:hypothetical protein